MAAAAVVSAGAIAIVLSLTTGGGTGKQPVTIAAPPAAQGTQAPSWLMSLTPARLAAGAPGHGLRPAGRHERPDDGVVLASMSPQARRYTEAVTSLTFAQLAAGAAGSP